VLDWRKAMEDCKIIPEDRKRRLDSLFEAFSIIAEDTYVYLCDMRYDYSRWSKELVKEFNMPGEYMYKAGEIWEEHIHPEDRKGYHQGIDLIFKGESDGHDMQYRSKRGDGYYVLCTCRGMVLFDENGEPEYFGGAIRNHDNQSHIDRLTGLRNQYGFFEDLKNYIANEKSVRICVVGIGKMTEINEMYGYAVGNGVLQNFARYLLENIGNRSETYRLDGAKYAIISTPQAYEDIRNRYEHCRQHFREGIKIDELYLMLELNAGTMLLDDFNTDYQTLYTCLNFAYDESKLHKHGDIVEFLNNWNNKKNQIEKLHAIRESINHDYKGFYLLYQPVIDVASQKIKGAEALLRWKNDKYGMIPPDDFIPLLEGDPLFPKLGEWILKKAMLDAKKIQEILPDFVININLSYSQLEKIEFTDMVKAIVKEIDYAPEKLELEMTERCRLLDIDHLRNVIVSLRAEGIRVALDDFGTGYSSIGLLRMLSFDTIKIDKSFVLKIEESIKECKFINTIVEMAKLFGTDVCVEGIETAKMRDILKEYDIRSFQGYFYSKPIELEEFLSDIKTEAKDFYFSKN